MSKQVSHRVFSAGLTGLARGCPNLVFIDESKSDSLHKARGCLGDKLHDLKITSQGTDLIIF